VQVSALQNDDHLMVHPTKNNDQSENVDSVIFGSDVTASGIDPIITPTQTSD